LRENFYPTVILLSNEPHYSNFMDKAVCSVEIISEAICNISCKWYILKTQILTSELKKEEPILLFAQQIGLHLCDG
jgi:hypothetical protein